MLDDYAVPVSPVIEGEARRMRQGGETLLWVAEAPQAAGPPRSTPCAAIPKGRRSRRGRRSRSHRRRPGGGREVQPAVRRGGAADRRGAGNGRRGLKPARRAGAGWWG